jgi:hypothetical protein
MSNPQQLVQKLWNYPLSHSYGGAGCNILSPARGFGATFRDDGLSYDVAEVKQRLSMVEELEAVVSANLQWTVRLRQSVLQKAFIGKLVTETRMD